MNNRDKIVKVKFNSFLNKLTGKGFKIDKIEGGKHGISFLLEKKSKKIAGFATKSAISDEEIIILD